jgi:alpha-L-rhamnosidase
VPELAASVSKEAMTIWQRWDSILEDGSINLGGMTSFNYYDLGSVAEWLPKAIGGILFPLWHRAERNSQLI